MDQRADPRVAAAPRAANKVRVRDDRVSRSCRCRRERGGNTDPSAASLAKASSLDIMLSVLLFQESTMEATILTNATAVDPSIAGKGYVHPEVLVSTDWLAEHLDDPNLRIIESDEDVLLYDTGHIPGAQKVDWHEDLNDPVLRDYVSSEQFEKLVREKGIDENTTVIFYGDKNNWWAAYAYWVFQLFGFTNAKLLDGGRIKWQQENRPMNTDVPRFPKTSYKAPPRSDEKIRAFFQQVREHSTSGKPLIDVRSPEEFTGKRPHMTDYQQEVQLRGGHIKGE